MEVYILILICAVLAVVAYFLLPKSQALSPTTAHATPSQALPPKTAHATPSQALSPTTTSVGGVQAAFHAKGIMDMEHLIVAMTQHTTNWSFCDLIQVRSAGYSTPEVMKLQSFFSALNLVVTKKPVFQIGKTLLQRLIFVSSLLSIVANESYAFTACEEVTGSNGCKPHESKKDNIIRKNCACGQSGLDYISGLGTPGNCEGRVAVDQIKASYGSKANVTFSVPWGGEMQCNTTSYNKGCCYWGRGAGQVTYPGNYDNVNTFMHEIGYLDANVDLCLSPDLLCKDSGAFWLCSLSFFYTWTVETNPPSSKSGTYFWESLKKAETAVINNDYFDQTSSYWTAAPSGSDIPFVWGLYGINASSEWECYGDSTRPKKCKYGYGCAAGFSRQLLSKLRGKP